MISTEFREKMMQSTKGARLALQQEVFWEDVYDVASVLAAGGKVEKDYAIKLNTRFLQVSSAIARFNGDIGEAHHLEGVMRNLRSRRS